MVVVVVEGGGGGGSRIFDYFDFDLILFFSSTDPQSIWQMIFSQG